jgi:hypothetical protein
VRLRFERRSWEPLFGKTTMRLLYVGGGISTAAAATAHPHLRLCHEINDDAWRPPPLIGGGDDYEMHCVQLL